MRIVIPAAGLGARFLPLTRVVPKELLPLGDLPLIHHALLEVDRAGYDEVVIVTSPRKPAMRAYFECDSALERHLEARGQLADLARLRDLGVLTSRVRVRFIEHETRGPGEAVVLAARLLGDHSLGVLLPDDVVLSSGHWRQMSAVAETTGAGVVSVTTFPPADCIRFGVAVCEPQGDHLRMRLLEEKPPLGTTPWSHRVFGRYIVGAPVIEALEARLPLVRDELQLTDGLAACLDIAGGVGAVEFHGEAFDCGTPGEYARSVARYAALVAA